MEEKFNQQTLHLKKDAKSTSARVWLIVIFLVFTLIDLGIKNLYPFLAVTEPSGGKTLVVEGWLPDNVIQEVTKIFLDGKYEKIYTTGGPLQQGYFLSKYKTNAELAKATLKEIGFDEKRVIAVPYAKADKDRTFASAIAFKEYLVTSDTTVKSLDVLSLGPHARRSQLLYQKALGKDFKVGIIASHQVGFTPEKWWKSSDGVRMVLDESIAYIYARLFFSTNK
ncbi:MAG: cytosine deaminase [Candidatus Marinimicrobia bacterium CG08_land_8_20_14_0_20_45_22]|nr:MAG: cytosine deaminase [Candidatus Marinimicrobia bacterium CG08_land_8_20_14_0_20_45_22]